MNCRFEGFLAALVVSAAVIACSDGPEAPGEAERVAQRMRRLTPNLQRALGEQLVLEPEVAIVTEDEMSERAERSERLLLGRVETNPIFPRRGASAGRWRRPYWGAAFVDESGRVWINRALLSGRVVFPGTTDLPASIQRAATIETDGPIDGVLAHELVHVYQMTRLAASDFLHRATGRTDLRARMALLEGHACALADLMIDGNVLPRDRASDGSNVLLESTAVPYGMFENEALGRARMFPYVEARDFVAAAIAQHGPVTAMRHLMADPPSLRELESGGKSRERNVDSAESDEIAHRVRALLDNEWPDWSCEPMPSSAFMLNLRLAPPEAQIRARRALVTVQRFEANGRLAWYQLRGHVLEARDESGARSVYAAWVSAAMSRDGLGESETTRSRGAVVDAFWRDVVVDGREARLAQRRYRACGEPTLEHGVVAISGRFVVELRLVEAPGGDMAAMRLCRQIVGAVRSVTEAGAVTEGSASSWPERWWAIARPDALARTARRGLADSDVDVRLAALCSIQRQSGWTYRERDSLAGDPDPAFELARTYPDARRGRTDELLGFLETSGDPWLVSGALYALCVVGHERRIPGSVLERALLYPDAAVQRLAARIIARGRDGSVDEALALVGMAVDGGDPDIGELALPGLIGVRSRSAGVGAVLERAMSSSRGGLARAALALAVIFDDVVIDSDFVLPLLGDPEMGVDAAVLLGRQGADVSGAVPRMRRLANTLAKRGDLLRRLRVLNAIAHVSGDYRSTVGVYRDALRTGDEADAVSCLVAARESTTILAQLLPELRQCIENGRPSTKVAALRSASLLGTEAEALLPFIDELCDDADVTVRKAARRFRRKYRRR